MTFWQFHDKTAIFYCSDNQHNKKIVKLGTYIDYLRAENSK